MPRQHRPSGTPRQKQKRRAGASPGAAEKDHARCLQIGVQVGPSGGKLTIDEIADRVVAVRDATEVAGLCSVAIVAVSGSKSLEVLGALANASVRVTALLPAEPYALIGLLGLAIGEKELLQALERAELYEWPDSTSNPVRPATLETGWMQDRLQDFSDVLITDGTFIPAAASRRGEAKRKGPPVVLDSPSHFDPEAINLAEFVKNSGAIAL